jgi:hypothetical protein
MALEKSEKTKAVEAALLNIEKQFGKGAIMRLGDHKSEDVPVISTSSIGLDAAVGVGGLPRGRVIEIFGPESSGKTTLALHVVAQPRRRAGSRPTSTPNTLSTQSTPRSSASTSTTCSSRSPIRANRRWRSPNRWCGRTRLTCW